MFLDKSLSCKERVANQEQNSLMQGFTVLATPKIYEQNIDMQLCSSAETSFMESKAQGTKYSSVEVCVTE